MREIIPYVLTEECRFFWKRLCQGTVEYIGPRIASRLGQST